LGSGSSPKFNFKVGHVGLSFWKKVKEIGIRKSYSLKWTRVKLPIRMKPLNVKN
jgi:hypothetical protein